VSSLFKISPARILKISETLPGAPRLLVELDKLLQDPNSDLVAITTVLRRDMALTGRIVRIANGVVYSRGEPVGELEEALARVGFGEIFRLISVASMLQMTEVRFRFYPITAKTLRENALFAALLMESLAPSVGIEPRVAYTAGLVRSVGRVVLDLAAQQEKRNIEVPTLTAEGLITWERSLFGMTSYQASYHVLSAWRFPADVVVAVRDQLMHDLTVDPLPIAKLLNVSVAAAYGAGHSMLGGQFFLDRYSARARADLGITEEQVAAAVAQVTVEFERIKAILA
jgi:HD-like signal output (HDOD) protein